MIETFTLEIRVITPVHIGMGEKYSKLEIVYNPSSKEAGLLRERKWLQFLVQKGWVDDYIQGIQRQGMRLDNHQFLLDKGIRDPLKGLPDLFSCVIPVEQNPSVMNDILRHIKDVYQQPYFPGSSIKGSFRTAILVAMIRRAIEEERPEASRLTNVWDRFESEIRNPDVYKRNEINNKTQKFVREIEEILFKPVKNGLGQDMDRQLGDPFRGVAISDSLPFDRDSTILVKKHDLVFPAGRNPVSEISLWRECIRPGRVTRIEVSLNLTHTMAAGLDIVRDADSLISCLAKYREVMYKRHERLLIDEIQKSSNSQLYDLQKLYGRPGSQPLSMGGGVGFQTKSMIYALAPSTQTANQTVEALLEKLFNGKHQGRDKVAAPRTIKTSYLSKDLGVRTDGRHRIGVVEIRKAENASSSGNPG